MSEVQQPEPPPVAIPPRVRSYVYLAGQILGGVASTVVGVTAVVAPTAVATVAGVCGAILGGVAFIMGTLGVAYRPAPFLGGPTVQR